MWSVVFALIPKRYLVGTGAAIAALLLGYGAVKLYGHTREVHGFAKGYAVAHDSAVEATIVRLAAAESLHTHRSDSLLALAVLDSAPAPAVKGPRVLRIEPVVSDSLVPIVPLSNLVKIYVASDSVPTAHYADRFIADLVVWQDSVIYKEFQPRLTRALAANKQFFSAWREERAAHNDADSTSHYWQGLYEEHRTVQPQASASRMHRIAYLALGVAAGFIAARHIR